MSNTYFLAFVITFFYNIYLSRHSIFNAVIAYDKYQSMRKNI